MFPNVAMISSSPCGGVRSYPDVASVLSSCGFFMDGSSVVSLELSSQVDELSGIAISGNVPESKNLDGNDDCAWEIHGAPGNEHAGSFSGVGVLRLHRLFASEEAASLRMTPC